MGVESLSDVELIERVLSREDAAAADELGQRCLAKLRKAGWLVRLCPPSQDRHAFVEDVIALAAHKVLRSLGSCKYNFDTWVGVVGTSVAKDHAKHLLRRAKHETLDQEPLDAADAKTSGSGDAALWGDASAWAHEDELTRVIGAAIEAHARTDRDSAIVVLMTPEYSVAEIAAKRGRSETTIRSWRNHDFPALREFLGDRFGIRHPEDILKE